MIDANDSQKQDPSEPTANEKDTVRPVAVPRPTEVRPLNALDSTPPPFGVELEETPLLVDDDLLIDDEPNQPTERPTQHPNAPATSRPGPLGVKSRFSTAPPKQPLSARLPTSAPPKASEPSSPPIPLRMSASKLPALSTLGPRSPLTPKRLSQASVAPTAHRTSTSSLVPGPLSSRPPQAEVPLECPSSERLAETNQTDKWLTRAAAFETHASTCKDIHKKGRLLVLASELYAMAGHLGTARAIAERAAKLGNHLAQRQARQLAQVSGDTKSAAAYFGLEANTAATPATRRHALLAHSEFERWTRKDTLTAARLLDQLPRLEPLDPFPHVTKLARALGQSSAPPTHTWPSSVEFGSLTDATATLRRLRGDARAKCDAREEPVPAFLEARRALERRDRVAAAAAIIELKTQPGFERAALWLASVLLATTAPTRLRAVELLQEMNAQRSTKAVRRALLTRALELGDNESVLRGLAADSANEAADRAFSQADQLVLSALCQTADQTSLRRVAIEDMDEAERPILAAASLSANCPDLAGPLGPTSATMVTISHGLARPSVSPTWVDAPPVFLLLGTGQDSSDAPAPPSPAELMKVPGLVDAGSPALLTFVAAILAETLGDLVLAQELFVESLGDPTLGEAALRCLMGTKDSEQASGLLESFAERQADPELRAEALAQAALLTQNQDRQQRLCLEAHSAAPDHVLVEGVIFRFSPRAQLYDSGETIPPPNPPEAPSQVSSTLTSRRLAILSHHSIGGDDDYLRALALLRHVFTKPSSSTRPTLLGHAWDLWPRDLALLELRERHGNLPLEVRAKARETLANSVNGARTRSALRVESALFFELAGSSSSAARVAHPNEQRPALLDGCFGRNAPGTEFAALWRQKVLERAQSAEHSVERAHYWLQAARLASDAGDWAAERESVGRAIHLDHQNVESLLTAEVLAFKDGEVERIAEVERYLAEALSAPDHLAHAQLSSRFFQLSAGSSSGYAPLCACVDDTRTPLEVARRLAYLAPRMGDDDLGYRMYCQLLNAAQRGPDKAVLLMRCAELALRLGRSGSALTHLEDALELQPDHISAWSLRAEVLASGGYHAAAAEAFERLANVAQSRVLRAVAHKRAADELLKETPMSTSGETHVTVTPAATIVADPHRLRVNLERALEVDPDDEEVFGRLVDLYVRMHLEGELNELFLRRIEDASPDAQQRRMLHWSQACAAVGAHDRASELVRGVLNQYPDNPNALEQLAGLTPDAAEREQTLLQLIRVSPSPSQQSGAYRHLGDFYRQQGSQRSRAIRCYQEASKRKPDDYELFRLLVDAQIEAEDWAGAQANIDGFAQRATSEPDLHSIAVARAVLTGARDPKAGELQLLALLDRRPYDGVVLTELSQLYLRYGNAEKLAELNARIRSQAELELPSGPHIAQYLGGLASLARLRADNSAWVLVGAVSSLYHGAPSGLDARGSRALSKTLDPLLAPSPLIEPMRELLARTSDAFEEAFPLNVATLNPVPLDEPRLRASFEMKAKAVGLTAPDLLVVAGDPYSCQVTHRPSRVLLGVGWVQSAPAGLQDFVVWHSLKLLQARVGSFARLSGETARARIEALLGAYVEFGGGLQAQAAESDRLQALLQPLLPKDTTLGPLAKESLAALAQSDMDVQQAVSLWVHRCAMLATGEPRTALHAVCLLHGETPSNSPGALLDAVNRLPAARRLLASLLAPHFVEAHRSIH